MSAIPRPGHTTVHQKGDSVLRICELNWALWCIWGLLSAIRTESNLAYPNAAASAPVILGPTFAKRLLIDVFVSLQSTMFWPRLVS